MTARLTLARRQNHHRSTLLRRLWSALQMYRRAQRHRTHLHRLPDAILRDIGIERAEIDRAIRRPRP